MFFRHIRQNHGRICRFFRKIQYSHQKQKTEADQICPGSSFFGIYIRYNAPYFCRTNQFFHYAAPEKAA